MSKEVLIFFVNMIFLTTFFLQSLYNMHAQIFLQSLYNMHARIQESHENYYYNNAT